MIVKTSRRFVSSSNIHAWRCLYLLDTLLAGLLRVPGPVALPGEDGLDVGGLDGARRVLLPVRGVVRVVLVVRVLARLQLREREGVDEGFLDPRSLGAELGGGGDCHGRGSEDY